MLEDELAKVRDGHVVDCVDLRPQPTPPTPPTPEVITLDDTVPAPVDETIHLE